MDMTSLVKDGKIVVYLSGEIDHHTTASIRESIDRLIVSQKPSALIMDLKGVNFMDSSGLGLILGRYRKIKELSGEMYLCGADERTMKILKMAGVDKLIKSIDSNATADNSY